MILVQAMLEQIAPVSAEERLEYLTDTAVASGNVKKEFSQRHQRSLAKHRKPEKRAATVADLTEMGFQVNV